jgi:hypoxanthine phosphoribosyltransferase
MSGYAASPHISGKTIILVDDGIATGSTMRAAIAALGQNNARPNLSSPYQRRLLYPVMSCEGRLTKL